MDFTTQPKLSRSEWNSVEEPVSEDESRILKLIVEGYNNVNMRQNNNCSLLMRLKIEKTPAMEKYLYCKFFKHLITEIQKTANLDPTLAQYAVKEESTNKLKKADLIRLENLTSKMNEYRATIIEYAFIEFAGEMLKLFTQNKPRYAFYLYTIIQLRNISIENMNFHVMEFVDMATAHVNEKTVLSSIISGASDFIEKNHNLYKYGDITLYDHQKRLFSVLKKSREYTLSTCVQKSNLILYIAPTGTGKTLSPIGLTEQYRVIFVCAARHVGLALAKSAISAHKCVAFAFGCETSSDIRLHHYSALSYKRDKRSGGIGKVDNSVGNKVEIMICDVKSYLTAMYYMRAFKSDKELLTYWDEPTIGMDDANAENPLHEIIHRNWDENLVHNMVLSSATLPKSEELQQVIDDFRGKFYNAVVTEINSYDCNKSITLLNKMGYCVCPHLLHADYEKMIECAEYCDQNKTLLRYFDLTEVVRFIKYLTQGGDIREEYSADAYFDNSIAKIKMNSLKLYYIELLKQIREERWSYIYKAMKDSLTRRNMTPVIKKSVSVGSVGSRFGNSLGGVVGGGSMSRTTSVSPAALSAKEPANPLDELKEKSAASGNILLTTVDAHTLTDGPTIYLAEDVDKIGQFYVQQSNIPRDIFDEIIKKITHNNAIMEMIEVLNQKREDALGEEIKKENKMNKMTCDEFYAPAIKRLDDSIEELKTQLKTVTLDSMFVPNTMEHQEVWVSKNSNDLVKNAFVPTINTDAVKEIMSLLIPDGMKLLVLLGIGVFSSAPNKEYLEIIKRLAFEKRLFIIIASSDYIYGTNYQFCHGFIGRDLTNMTQQKTIQALGRIGRNNIQQDYTARFRNDDIIANLFCVNANNVEAENMCRLLRTD